MTLKGSCPVREGGVGVVGIPTPGLLPHVGVRESRTQGEGRQVMGDLQQQGTRDAERRHCQRSQPRHRKTSASVYITGKRCDAKVSRTVWREADGKGLQSRVPRWRPTLPSSQLVPT